VMSGWRPPIHLDGRQHRSASGVDHGVMLLLPARLQRDRARGRVHRTGRALSILSRCESSLLGARVFFPHCERANDGSRKQRGKHDVAAGEARGACRLHGR
jgi:hypothetical protein